MNQKGKERNDQAKVCCKTMDNVKHVNYLLLYGFLSKHKNFAAHFNPFYGTQFGKP